MKILGSLSIDGGLFKSSFIEFCKTTRPSNTLASALDLKSLFFNNPKEGSTDIEIDVFDNQEDLELYASKLTDGISDIEEKAQNTDTKGNCTSYDIWGSGRFYFYKHIYYNTSMSGMNRYNRYYYRDHWVGSSYNDQLSSLIVTKPSNKRALVYLYQHSCFNGRIISFYQNRLPKCKLILETGKSGCNIQ